MTSVVCGKYHPVKKSVTHEQVLNLPGFLYFSDSWPDFRFVGIIVSVFDLNKDCFKFALLNTKGEIKTVSAMRAYVELKNTFDRVLESPDMTIYDLMIYQSELKEREEQQ